MVKAVFERVRGNFLRPVDPAAQQFVESLKTGVGVTVEAKRKVNVKLHKKIFVLMNFAFELWEPPQTPVVPGHVVTKNFEVFRKHLLVMAGFFDAHYAPDGTVHLEPHSMAYRANELDRQIEMYRGILTVVWERILSQTQYRSPEEVDNIVNQLMSFE